MQNKKTFLLTFGIAIFLGGFVFFAPTKASANYPATISGGYAGAPVSYCDRVWATYGGWYKNVCTNNCTAGGDIGPFMGWTDYGCTKTVGYVKAAWYDYRSYSGLVPIYNIGCTNYGCTYTWGVGYDTAFGAAFYVQKDPTPGSIPFYSNRTSGTLLGYLSNISTVAANYSCPSGGVLSGTTCITDNLCAANTCSNATCWNNLAWVTGTKNCNVDNLCAVSTCSTATCWNSYQWVAGTKICNVDNGCAANTCGLPLPAASCWNSYQWVSGTKDCRVDNGCAANTCQASNSGMPTTCDNGINPFTPGTKLPVFNDICMQTPVTCTQADCGKTIPTQTTTCSRLDSTNCMNATACLSSCPAPATQTCPSCPLETGVWKEVAP